MYGSNINEFIAEINENSLGKKLFTKQMHESFEWCTLYTEQISYNFDQKLFFGNCLKIWSDCINSTVYKIVSWSEIFLWLWL